MRISRLRNSCRVSRRRGRNGYILVTVLALLTVVTLMLARMSNVSIREASLAIAREKQMRQRWAVVSLRRYGLAVAEDPGSSNMLLGNEGISVKLADDNWQVHPANDSGKLNLSKLVDTYNQNTVLEAGRALVGGSGPFLQLAPSSGSSSTSRRFDQWLRFNRYPIADDQWIASTRRITLWGDGRLDIVHADMETVDAMWRVLFGRGAPKELHAMRSESVTLNLQDFFASLDLRQSQLQTANRWLTDQSTVHSTWVLCQSNDRIPSYFFVSWGRTKELRTERGYTY